MAEDEAVAEGMAVVDEAAVAEVAEDGRQILSTIHILLQILCLHIKSIVMPVHFV